MGVEQCGKDREGDSFHATCARTFTTSDCDVRQRLDLGVTRQSETLSGQGYWFAVLEGTCAGLGSPPCERIVVEGIRTSSDISPCVP
jgi:hypothetical protein